jgi:antiviral helicase SKI2
MSSTSREKMDDFNAKVRVLLSYGYIDKDMNLLFKGKVAMDIQSTDKILTTELLFSGLLKDLPLPELIALFSVLNP